MTVTPLAGELTEVQEAKRPSDLELGRKHVLDPGSGARPSKINWRAGTHERGKSKCQDRKKSSGWIK